ncbi:MAG: class II aldolase/adducin family protein [Actinomycetota bacterium]|nr:class II aldolase/adducin family protein [Actinomycetota bacterium]
MEGYKEEIIQAAKEVYEKGLVIGRVGNISCRVDEGRILISSTGACLGKLSERDLVVLDSEGEKLEGEEEPSTEKWVHIEIYKARPDVNAIVHTHSPYASALAYLKKSLRPVNPEGEYILGRVPVVPPFVYGTRELAEAVRDHLRLGKAALLEMHGVVTVGEDLNEAVNIAELVEEVARINYLIEMLEK